MLRRLSLRDVVIVPALDLELGEGFTALTGETGAGKSILIDALQMALGARADAVVVREGAARAEVAAEFDAPPMARHWLQEAGFDSDDGAVLLRRTVDAQGRSRAWINGSAATVTQLREVAEWLVDIHGQHAWQGLTRQAAVRALIDQVAGTDTHEVAQAHAERRQAAEALTRARDQQAEIERERERLAWQVGELDKLAPADGEWAELSGEHERLAHGQALLEAARAALEGVSEADDGNAESLALRAIDGLSAVVQHDARLTPVVDALNGAVAQLQDAAHSLSAYLRQMDPDPGRLAELDARLSVWMGLARRFRRPPDELPALWTQWRQELAALDAATDLEGLTARFDAADRRCRDAARTLSRARSRAAVPLALAVTEAMQTLGMDGGRFEVALLPLDEPQAHGMDEIELRVAGHAGATPRALAKVASGGELSRLALAIAVCTTAEQSAGGAGTLIFDEIDAGVGGAVGDTVGALMRRLGQRHQVLAVTHLAQVAACADHQLVVAKALQTDGHTISTVHPVQGEDRVAEVARMLGGVGTPDTRLAHARGLLTPEGKGNASGRPRASAALNTNEARAVDGLAAAKGAKGAKGVDGTKRAKGPQGPQGATGAKAAEGAQEATGPNGAQRAGRPRAIPAPKEATGLSAPASRTRKPRGAPVQS